MGAAARGAGALERCCRAGGVGAGRAAFGTVGARVAGRLKAGGRELAVGAGRIGNRQNCYRAKVGACRLDLNYAPPSIALAIAAVFISGRGRLTLSSTIEARAANRTQGSKNCEMCNKKTIPA